jgi:hypothetical protein
MELGWGFMESAHHTARKWRTTNTDQEPTGTLTYPDPDLTETKLNRIANALSQYGQQQAMTTPHKTNHPGTRILAPKTAQRSITVTSLHSDSRVRLRQHANNTPDDHTIGDIETETGKTEHQTIKRDRDGHPDNVIVVDRIPPGYTPNAPRAETDNTSIIHKNTFDSLG